MRPSATYRLQLHHEFTFKDLKKYITYLEQLGISTIYASPIFAAVSKSTHGYDVTDPHIINPEIGTEEQLLALTKELRNKNMSWLQDIVPNHMGFDSANDRLMDVLERGSFSEYANFFDIDWKHPDPQLSGKVLVPFLGEELQVCLEKKELRVEFDEQGFVLKYFDTAWPISISVYDLLLPRITEFTSTLGKESTELLVQQISDLSEKATSGISKKEWTVLKEEWIRKISDEPEKVQVIQENIDWINQEQALLKEIVDGLYYLPAYWRITENKIDYRRFFTVNGLICLRMEDPEVFNEYHQYIKHLYDRDCFDGLRIDHIDGLYDPADYTKQLRKLVGSDAYIVAEKILAWNEDLPADWDLQGTSGYEFLSQVSRLLTDVDGANQLTQHYKNMVAGQKNYEDVVFQNKLFILITYMKGELNNLGTYLKELKLFDGSHDDYERMVAALAVFMAAFPVYRIYPDSFPIDQVEYAEEAFQKALQRSPQYKSQLQWIRSLFEARHDSLEEISGELLFLKRLMQFTGPLAAKGVEDTAFYFYNPLISHNEVGDAPSKPAITTKAFHRQMLNRQNKTPFSLNATSTHDTKRGEDARIRINLLSELPKEWISAVDEWRNLNQRHKKIVNGSPIPALNEEYFIYQAMIGGFPTTLDPQEEDVSRLKEYIRKFLREEKMHTDWTEPDEVYEEACFSFIDQLFNKNSEFLTSFIGFIEKLKPAASIYSLAQALIKITAPGIPDVYQGCELWDLSYVDPDNRRPVDYHKRIELLEHIVREEREPQKLLNCLRSKRDEGMEKLYVVYKSLQFRRKNNDMFLYGEYLPLKIEGANEDAIAFARKLNDQWCVVVVPLQVAKKKKQDWSSLKIILPSDAPDQWRNEFTGEKYSSGNLMALSTVFAQFPIALLSSA